MLLGSLLNFQVQTVKTCHLPGRLRQTSVTPHVWVPSLHSSMSLHSPFISSKPSVQPLKLVEFQKISWALVPIALVRPYSIDAVLTKWTIVVRIWMITLVDVDAAFVVNLLVAGKALARCVSNWIIWLAKGSHLVGIIRATAQIGTGHSITNTLVSFQMIPIKALAWELRSNYKYGWCLFWDWIPYPYRCKYVHKVVFHTAHTSSFSVL